MPFAWDELPSERFFEEYWRKKPVLIKGGASKILDFEVDVPFFKRVCQKLDRSPLALVNREPGFIFAQKMDEAEPRFRAIARRYEELVSVKRVWFDGVFTTDTHTIGCHYDHSDNFVLQQSGTKHWKLASPKMIPAAEIRARMLEHGNVGHIHMPDECEDFMLEAGDVLYIPLFWAHWGVSHGTAMSVSLVLNADAPVDVLASPLRRVLSEHQSWVEPLPAIPRPREGGTPPPEVEAVLDRLFSAMSAPTTRAALRSLLWREVFVEPPTAGPENEAKAGAPYGTAGRLAFASPLDLPRGRLQHLLDTEWPEPEPSSLVEPGGDHAALLAHLGQRAWLRASLVLDIAHERFPEASVWPAVSAAIQAMTEGEDEAVLDRALDPEFVAWVWRVEEASSFSYAPRFEEISAEFSEIERRWSSQDRRPTSFLDPERSWLYDHYPRGKRFGGRRVDRSSEARAALIARCMSLQEERAKLPAEIQAEMSGLLRASMPMVTEGTMRATHSIEPFFGTVLIVPARAELDDLLFETGRMKARSLANLVELTIPHARDRVASPFEDATMSAARLFADAFGARYVAKVRGGPTSPEVLEAFRRLSACPALSATGQELLRALHSSSSQNP